MVNIQLWAPLMDDGKPSFLTYEELCTISDPHFEVAKTQHVPNPAAQDPADWPPFSAHSVKYWHRNIVNEGVFCENRILIFEAYHHLCSRYHFLVPNLEWYLNFGMVHSWMLLRWINWKLNSDNIKYAQWLISLIVKQFHYQKHVSYAA